MIKRISCRSVGCLVMLLMLAPLQGYAAWPFGNDSGIGGSGLDLEQGYDRNTVVTVAGVVAAVPDTSVDPVRVEMVVGNERLLVVLAPRWYLQDDNLEWKVGEPITVRGSRAQGKDGRIYLLAQWATAPGGGPLVLRSNNGHPDWVHGGGGGGRLGGAPMQWGGGGRKGH